MTDEEYKAALDCLVTDLVAVQREALWRRDAHLAMICAKTILAVEKTPDRSRGLSNRR